MKSKKNLPIKIFEKREKIDERFTEGGGGNPPKWVLKGEELIKKSKTLRNDLNKTEDDLKMKFNNFQGVPAVIKAKLNEDAGAKSHRKELNKFLTADKSNDRFVGVSNNNELLIRIDNIHQLDEIYKNIKDFDKHDKAISGIERINAFEPEVTIEKTEPKQDGKYVIKIRLFDFNNHKLNDFTLVMFKEFLKTNREVEFLKTVKYSEQLYIHEVSVDSLDSIKSLEKFIPVMSIELMPLIEVTENDDFFIEKSFEVPKPEDNLEYPIIGILDSGIADIDQLSPWKYGKRYTNYPNTLLNLSHGTFVAGVINYGDTLEGKEYTGTDKFKILDAVVIPNLKLETITEGDLINNIREVVEENRNEVKIWNLSVGIDQESKNAEFSRLGIALDNIQDENKVLIIKSAGNCSNFQNNMPVKRIAGGADSVRSLTVGSIAQSKSETDFSKINHLSPFSRIGPGPVNLIKPEFVHYGGNCGVIENDVVINGVTSFDPRGNLTTKIGTSYSTPRITAMAADLNDKLKGEFDPILLKALLIHSARYPNEVDLSMNEKINQLGFGTPNKTGEILYNNPYEITLILRDTLNKSEFIEILDFPFPSSLVENEHFTGQITLTMVNNPILQGGQGPEYCQSDIQVNFGTYDTKKARDISLSTIKNPIGREGGKNILISDIYSKKKIKENEKFIRSEKVLVQYGKKYYPNKKYSVNLNEITPTNKEKFLNGSKKWCLKIEGVYRDFIENKAEIENIALSQDFCVIITIKDPSQTKLIYDEVTQLLESNNFIHRNITVKQDIDISLE
ncbi:S8 family peptidase [Exiguobacterium sp. S90]|uniref:S8 family peptidase n=1 Tax=Exiguobacterium sp. S90 TaxID=1221231 RepID=UPI001BE5B7E1|nr:S8 family peptidase [Exiguobacterium sp. S90]